MALFICETALEYGSSKELLLKLRHTVKELRQSHPELKDCFLADLTMQKGKTGLKCVLCFHPEH